MTTAPIALFVYNRPVHTCRVIESLLGNPEAGDSSLFVFSDGPKDGQAAEAVAEVRRMLRRITGFRSVEVIERPANLGLVASIVDGVGRLVRDFGSAIVVEDDLVLSPRFLEFLNLGLRNYRDVPRVMQVSGYMYPTNLDDATTAGFLPTISCWGWGTWARAWECYDPTMPMYAKLKANRALRRRFNLDGAYPYYDMLESQRQGDIDSWGVVWNLSVFAKDGLVLYPRQSLVSNAGFDGSGTHGSVQSADGLAASPLWGYMGEFNPPQRIEVDLSYYEASCKAILAAQKGWRGLWRKLAHH